MSGEEDKEKKIHDGALEIGKKYVDELNNLSGLDIEAFKSRYVELAKDAFEKLTIYLDSDKGTQNLSLRTSIAEEVLTRMILGQYNKILEQRGVKNK